MAYVVRHSNGLVYESSCQNPSEYEEYGTPFDGIMSKPPKNVWFFRQVELRGWWIFKSWKETGNVWKCESGREFTVLDFLN